MTTPTLLCWNLPPERAGRIRALCAVRRVRMREVPPEDWGEPVGALSGLLARTGAAAPAERFDGEMLLLCGFSEAALDTFLRDFRRSGLAPVGRKAVLTPANAMWTSVELFAELDREHRAMHPEEG